MKMLWIYWCKALGRKAFADDRRADRVALIRTAWVIMHIITCIFICLNSMKTLGIL